MIHCSWPASLESVPRIRRHVQAEMELSGLDHKTVMHLGLAVEEITANIVHHAYENLPGGSIEIDIEKGAGGVSIHIRDKGQPFDPLTAPEPDVRAATADRRVGGLGLFLIRKLVDEIRYERDGDQNHLTIVKSYRTR